MSIIYIMILIGDFIWYKFDPSISYPLERDTGNRFSSLIEVGIAAAGFFLLNATLLSFLNLSSTFQSMLSLLATATPVLAGNKILTFVGWGILIPIIETSFFNGRLLEGLLSTAESRFNIRVATNKLTIPMFLVIFVVAALFALFHLTAKNLDSIPLLLTFIFSVVSSILVVRNGELKQAILLHMIINSLAVLSEFGII